MLRTFLTDIITQAGCITLDFRSRLSSMDVVRKSDKDLVSAADVSVETFLIEQIKTHYPSHAVLGEESGSHGDSEYRWIIDPIDGTTSFVHGQPFYAVSVALEKDGDIVMGAVYAPVLDELFFAEKGKGADCNGKPIQVSPRDTLLDSVLGTGFACVRADVQANNLPYFNAVVPHIRGIRRYGSASIDLSYVACARLEGFWELNLKIYDIAAGGLIVSEAGGRITDFAGGRDHLPGRIVATNGLIHDALLALLASANH